MRRRKVERKVLEVRSKYSIVDRPFTKSDFFRICEGEEIELITPDIALPTFKATLKHVYGACITSKEIAAIYLRCFWQKKFRRDVAFHELGHFFMGHAGSPLNAAFDQSSDRHTVEEAEADLFAELATGLIMRRRASK